MDNKTAHLPAGFMDWTSALTLVFDMNRRIKAKVGDVVGLKMLARAKCEEVTKIIKIID